MKTILAILVLLVPASAHARPSHAQQQIRQLRASISTQQRQIDQLQQELDQVVASLGQAQSKLACFHLATLASASPFQTSPTAGSLAFVPVLPTTGLPAWWFADVDASCVTAHDDPRGVVVKGDVR